MKKSLSKRGNIPFYCEKSEEAFRRDPYERYEEMVIRQTAIHLADELWGEYPFQALLDWMKANMPLASGLQIADIGCGVGRLVGELAIAQPDSQFWGIDYSYQMLRRAAEYWLSGEAVSLNWTERGMRPLELRSFALPNLQLGLAKASELPFETESLDVLCSSFLLDRLDDPKRALAEFNRVLKVEGILLLASPLNFQNAEHWVEYYPVDKLIQVIENQSFKVENIINDLKLEEPIDRAGNKLIWNCWLVKAMKST